MGIILLSFLVKYSETIRKGKYSICILWCCLFIYSLKFVLAWGTSVSVPSSLPPVSLQVSVKSRNAMVLPSHEANVFFHSLADVLQFITSVRYKGKYI